HNILYPYVIQWLTLTSGVTGNDTLFENSDFWISKFTELYTQNLPFKDLDRIGRNDTSLFQKWVAHPKPDAYWNAMNLTPEDYRRIEVPILTITGHYD